MGLDTKTDWTIDRRSYGKFGFDFELSQLRVAVVRSEKLVAGTQRKGNVRPWKPLSSNG
jgi:hypothetical protein